MNCLNIFILSTCLLVTPWKSLFSEETFATSSLSQESHVFLSSLSNLNQKAPSLEGVYPVQSAPLSSGNEIALDQGGSLLSDAKESSLSDKKIEETVMPKTMSESACDYFQSSHSCSSHDQTDACCIAQDDCSHHCEEYDECCCCCCCEDEEEGGSGGSTDTTTGGGSGSTSYLTGIDSGGGSGSTSGDTTGEDTTGQTPTTTTNIVVPEPQTYLLLGTALVIVMWLKKRRKEIYCEK